LSLEVVGGFLLKKKTAVSSISRETMMQAESLSIESKRNQENKIKSNIFEVIQHLLKDFGRKWVNYTDIYERNQSVKNYLIDCCIKENGIDNDPHVQQKNIGRIHNVSQDITQTDHYLLFGEQKSNAVTRFLFIQLKINQKVQKIYASKIYYVRSAY